MHNVKNGQKLKILTVKIAVAADVSPSFVADEISALLSENGVADPESSILDWGYVGGPDGADATASDDYEEGEFLNY